MRKRYLEHSFKIKTHPTNPVVFTRKVGSDICIVMTGDEGIYPYYHRTMAINLLYAEKHGYDFCAVLGRLLDPLNFKPHYDRYRLMLDLMPRYKFILYIDSDAFVKEPSIPLSKWVGAMNTKDFMLVSKDMEVPGRNIPINSGVMLIRNCEQGKRFCEAVLNSHPECRMERCLCGEGGLWYDQAVIDRLVEFHDKIRIVPYGLLQIFDKRGVDGEKAFIRHLAGENEKEREQKIRLYHISLTRE